MNNLTFFDIKKDVGKRENLYAQSRIQSEKAYVQSQSQLNLKVNFVHTHPHLTIILPPMHLHYKFPLLTNACVYPSIRSSIHSKQLRMEWISTTREI